MIIISFFLYDKFHIFKIHYDIVSSNVFVWEAKGYLLNRVSQKKRLKKLNFDKNEALGCCVWHAGGGWIPPSSISQGLGG